MAIKTTIWYPNTCGCAIEYTWDDKDPEETRINTFSKTLQVCPAHTAVKDTAQHKLIIDEESQRMNILFYLVKDRFADATPEKSYFNFVYNQSRVLEVTLPKLNNQQKAVIQTAADARFGTGKVLIK